ncbi:MAG: histidine ammonia-lyase [Firmicutes bacterium]|nr:histidine ammonia-lyase [Candidatus Fermentithermobacillaceae bacterium]
MTVVINGRNMTVGEIVRVAKDREEVAISQEAREQMLKSHALMGKAVEDGKRVYGINTGFGKFADTPISYDDLAKLQENLVRSHAAGVGPLFSQEEVRAAMLLRANALARGMSGIRVELVETIVEMLNKGVTPCVPERGSVGASGDLAPLAHIALVIIGEGQAFYKDDVMSGEEALDRAGIKPCRLEAKEGLALTNGVQMTNGVLSLVVDEGRALARAADIIASLTGQVLEVIVDAYDDHILNLRPQDGAREVGGNLRTLLEGSKLSTVSGQVRVQDSYVLRCIPQVHGAVRQGLNHVAHIVEIESGSATDNPLVLEDGRILSGGNFHGQPLAVAADYLGICLCSLGNISERRTARMMDSVKSGLPAFLTREGGLNSGFMLVQYTAASLVSENKVLAHPSSVDTVPTSADQEDHVSMSTIAARKARDIARNVSYVLAAEYLSACQGMEFLSKDALSPAGRAAYMVLRREIPPIEEDRPLNPDLEAARDLIVSGKLEKAVSQISGELL